MQFLILLVIIVIIYLWSEHAPARIKKRRKDALERAIGSTAHWDPNAHLTSSTRHNEEAPAAQQNARE
jgi:hypothetical protein